MRYLGAGRSPSPGVTSTSLEMTSGFNSYNGLRVQSQLVGNGLAGAWMMEFTSVNSSGVSSQSAAATLSSSWDCLLTPAMTEETMGR